MIIKIDDKILEKYQTNEELAKVIVDVLNGNFNYPNIDIYGEHLNDFPQFKTIINWNIIQEICQYYQDTFKLNNDLKKWEKACFHDNNKKSTNTQWGICSYKNCPFKDKILKFNISKGE